MLIGNDSHLTYCTNVHPGETWQEVLNNLETYTLPLKKRIVPDKPFGIGLRLSGQAAETLQQSSELIKFKEWLHDNDCYVFTLNGFPYGKFHGGRIKDQVHLPDWHQKRRRDYTNTLFSILSELMPDNVDGGISTSPITYRHWYSGEKVKDVLIQSTRHIIQVVEHLIPFKERYGKIMHLDIEPEPDGLIGNTAEFIRFYEDYLLRIGGRYLSEKISCTRNEAVSHILDHVHMCFDICHSSVEFEDAETAIREVLGKGINIGKIQISAALKSDFYGDEEHFEAVKRELAQFHEQAYLHQSVFQMQNHEIYRFKDVLPAIKAVDPRVQGELRSHFHMPVHQSRFGKLSSTSEEIEKTMSFWNAYEFCNHLEIETYSYNLWPDQTNEELIDGLQKEIEWVREMSAVTA